MTPAGPPQHSDITEMLATFGGRRPEDVQETLDSLDLTWLLHQLQERYGDFEVDDDTLDRMTTVTAVVEVLGEVLAGAGTGIGAGTGTDAEAGDG